MASWIRDSRAATLHPSSRRCTSSIRMSCCSKVPIVPPSIELRPVYPGEEAALLPSPSLRSGLPLYRPAFRRTNTSTGSPGVGPRLRRRRSFRGRRVWRSARPSRHRSWRLCGVPPALAHAAAFSAFLRLRWRLSSEIFVERAIGTSELHRVRESRACRGRSGPWPGPGSVAASATARVTPTASRTAPWRVGHASAQQPAW